MKIIKLIFLFVIGLACLLTTKSVATLLMPIRAGDAMLKITGFRVPALVTYGSDVPLDCPFSTLPGRTKLYSVKWYHNSDEFYRFIFADPTPVFTFPLPGVKVDVSSVYQICTVSNLLLGLHLIIYRWIGPTAAE